MGLCYNVDAEIYIPVQMSLCMAYVFAAVVEYAVANFIKKPEIDRLARRVFPISFSLLRNPFRFLQRVIDL